MAEDVIIAVETGTEVARVGSDGLAQEYDPCTRSFE